MRVLFTSSPGTGHVFPTISLAQAARAAGHDVLYAFGGSIQGVADAGLHVVDTSPGVDYGQVFGKLAPQFQRRVQSASPRETAELALRMFAHVSEPTIDATVRVADQWQPDVVVHTPLQAAGPLVAAKLGVPAVVHNLGFAQNGEFDGLDGVMVEELRAYYDKHGVSGPAKTSVRISVTPPSLVGGTPSDGTWPMRYVPYNGGGVVPEWLVERPQRRRVAVTLGTVLPMTAGMGALQPFLAAAGQIDAEFVLALGDVDYAALGDLPDNVRPVGYVPLGILLATCEAAIHHGGAGTTMTTVAAGIPQIVLPQGADQFMNADVAQAAGIGLRATAADVDAAMLDRLLTDPELRATATKLRDELLTMPSPATLVDRLAALAA